VGSLLGVKTVLNEFIAYVQMSNSFAENPNFLSPRSSLIAVYALCGFATSHRSAFKSAASARSPPRVATTSPVSACSPWSRGHRVFHGRLRRGRADVGESCDHVREPSGYAAGRTGETHAFSIGLPHHLGYLRHKASWFGKTPRRSYHNAYGSPLPRTDPHREQNARDRMKGEPINLTIAERTLVERAIREVAERYGWVIRSIAPQRDHVHVVITAVREGEALRNASKPWPHVRSTRRLERKLGGPRRAVQNICGNAPVSRMLGGM